MQRGAEACPALSLHNSPPKNLPTTGGADVIGGSSQPSGGGGRRVLFASAKVLDLCPCNMLVI